MKFRVPKTGEVFEDKPRICRVLGVEVGEVFSVRTDTGELRRFMVHGIRLHHVREDGSMGNRANNMSLWLVEHPDRIIRKPRFTEEEVADANAIRRMWPDGEVKFRRDMDGSCALIQMQGCCHGCLGLGKVELFPSVRPGQSVKLSEVMGDRQ